MGTPDADTFGAGSDISAASGAGGVGAVVATGGGSGSVTDGDGATEVTEVGGDAAGGAGLGTVMLGVPAARFGIPGGGRKTTRDCPGVTALTPGGGLSTMRPDVSGAVGINRRGASARESRSSSTSRLTATPSEF
ncbi:MAG: hypothetical protein RIC29_14775 [Rhodospirillaceae bacterium]